MDTSRALRLHPVPHQSAAIHQLGFPLDHPYVEQCWTPVIGPTSVLLLRRLPQLWTTAIPAQVELTDLSRSLGLGASTGPNGAMRRTLERLTRFRLASFSGPEDLDVYTEAPPVPQRQLDRLPSWTRDRHHHLLTQHLDHLARPHTPTNLTTALDRLHHPRPTTPTPARTR